MGGTLIKPQQEFVVVERKTLEAKSLVGAVDLAYKVYQVLNLEYAPQTQGIWTFLGSLVYGAKVPKELGPIKAFRAYYYFKLK